jgi:DNA-binding transcriptional MerR regulator
MRSTATGLQGDVARLTVRALATAVGISPDAVRFYERSGLLPAPDRTRAGYRSYTPDAIDRLRFIQGAQRLGLRLREIGDLLTVRDTGTCPCEPAEVLLRQRITEVNAELARLTKLRTELTAIADRLPAPDCPDLSLAPGARLEPSAEGGDDEDAR